VSSPPRYQMSFDEVYKEHPIAGNRRTFIVVPGPRPSQRFLFPFTW